MRVIIALLSALVATTAALAVLTPHGYLPSESVASSVCLPCVVDMEPEEAPDSDVLIPSHVNWLTETEVPQTTFTAASYNILAEVYGQSKYFPYASSECLKYMHRQKRLVAQIGRVQPDILAMQEVDNYDSYWKPQISAFGYNSVYTQRPGKKDGCAIFFKANLFQLESKTSVEFADQFQRIGVLATLSIKKRASAKMKRGNQIIIATTHLHWDHTAVKTQLDEVVTLLHKLNTINQHKHPVIIMGDFNSGPKDPLFNFLKTMKLPPSLDGASKETKAKIAETQEYTLLHAYSNYMDTKTEPPYSSFKPAWNGWIDYIWYWVGANDTIKLGPTRLLKMPSEQELRVENGGLPNTAFPSDHLMIMAEFGIVDKPFAAKNK